MRRTFVAALLGADVDPNSVRRLAGHSDSHSAVASAMLRKLDVDVLTSVNDAGAIEVPQRCHLAQRPVVAKKDAAEVRLHCQCHRSALWVDGPA